MSEKANYQRIANELRMLCADMVQEANSGHPGAPLGLADIAIVLANHINIAPQVLQTSQDSTQDSTQSQHKDWINRDRLIFSGGHASALLYSMLHLWGYDVSLQDLKEFRKLDSKTPGHPEFHHTQGVEITTGPLGQGIANAVGFALASMRAAHIFTRKIINHKIYCFCGDGDLEEGISYEACSLAGHHNLNNLVLIYDCNNISIEGDVNLAFSENVRARFEAQGFVVSEIDGHDFEQIDNAFNSAKHAKKPTLIIAYTKIAKNAYKLEGSHTAHGAPLGEEIIAKSKENLGLDSKKFVISKELRAHFESSSKRGFKAYKEWEKVLDSITLDSKELENIGINLENISINHTITQKDKSNSKHKIAKNSNLSPDFTKGHKKDSIKARDLLEIMQNRDFSSITLPHFSKIESKKVKLDSKNAIATRASNGQILNAIASAHPSFIGGSADLAPSNNTTIKHSKDFPLGINMHFGIREHAMGAISNAFANYGIFTPFCATFFVFSDYLSPSIRIAALMKAQVFYIFTHDSIGVGEDGATHEPIEQLSHLRAMPNLLNWRVADANENVLAWQNALNIQMPQTFILSRQNLPLIESKFITLENVGRGGYVISKSTLDSKMPKITLLASGSEVNLAIKTQEILESKGIADFLKNSDLRELLEQKIIDFTKRKNALHFECKVRPSQIDSILEDVLKRAKKFSNGIATQVVSLPCFELFSLQDSEYKREVFKDSKVLGIEAARALELFRICDDVLGMEGFGASGKGELLFKKYGFSIEGIIFLVLEMLG